MVMNKHRLLLAGAMDFKDGADKQEEYTWDLNGNMTRDRNKDIYSISYNVLNLPACIEYYDGHEVRYTYATDGRKLHVEYILNPYAIIDDEVGEEPFPGPNNTGSLEGEGDSPDGLRAGDIGPIGPPVDPPLESRTLMTRDYCGSHIYRNGSLERIENSYGYWADSCYHYRITDYQGNVRAVINQDGTLEEINGYYPYGGLTGAPATGVQARKYGGKELDRENGLDWYDSQARMYDCLTGRTPTMDPMSEKYYSINPYSWCKSNPVNRVDPNGMEDFYNLNGKYIYSEGDNHEKILVISYKSKEKDIRKDVQDNKFIPVPNAEIMDAMDEIFYLSDSNSPNEHGFNVYINQEKGSFVEGTPNSIDLIWTEDKLYDVHIHQWNGPNHKIGKADPSKGDLDGKKASKDNSVSIVLGYGYPTDLNTYAKTELGAPATQSKEKKEIGFYNTKMITRMDYNSFKEIIVKINEH